MNCTAVKQYFSARDPVLQKYISEISGTVRYWDLAMGLESTIVRQYEDDTNGIFFSTDGKHAANGFEDRRLAAAG